jgi:hypothetical protein
MEEAVDGVEVAGTEAVSVEAVDGKEVAEVSVYTYPYCLCSPESTAGCLGSRVTGHSDARFEVVTRNALSWDVTPCILVDAFALKGEIKMEPIISTYQTTRCHNARDHDVI